jgi:hypothetical protein
VVVVAIHQPFDCDPNLLFGEAAHLEQPRLELLELFLKMPDSLFSCFHITWGSAPYPGSVARGGPSAPRRSLAGALCAPPSCGTTTPFSSDTA